MKIKAVKFIENPHETTKLRKFFIQKKQKLF
jgi:hypothetical protein